MSPSESWPLLLLASARLWACLRCQASWRCALGPRWEWISAIVALALAALALLGGKLADPSPELARGWTQLGLALGFELLLGATLGALVSLPGHALVGAATTSDALLRERPHDPASPAAPASMTSLLVCASLAAGLSLGLHRPLLAALLAGFELLPLGDPYSWMPPATELLTRAPEAAAHASVLALALATPVLLTRALACLALACLARGGVNLEALSGVLAPGLRLALAMITLGAAWSSYPQAFARAL